MSQISILNISRIIPSHSIAEPSSCVTLHQHSACLSVLVWKEPNARTQRSKLRGYWAPAGSFRKWANIAIRHMHTSSPEYSSPSQPKQIIHPDKTTTGRNSQLLESSAPKKAAEIKPHQIRLVETAIHFKYFFLETSGRRVVVALPHCAALPACTVASIGSSQLLRRQI